jgi:hypothetical protein
VSRYLATVDAALPGLAGGLYVVGSTALGGLRPAVSDADFVVVTREPVTGPQCRALASVHAEATEFVTFATNAARDDAPPP